MSWSEYHLDDPAFCTPLPVMRGLVSALCERRDAIDSIFHESCTSSGMQAVVDNHLTEMLLCSAAEEIPFREIKKEYAYDPMYGGSGLLSFMHIFDDFLDRMLDGCGTTYDVRSFTDSSGAVAYSSLPILAETLSETLIIPERYSPLDSSTVKADVNLQVCLNSQWAAQRVRMLKLLRYVNVTNGGLIIRYAVPGAGSYGSSPQAAYDAISSWSFVEQNYYGESFGLECRVEYYGVQWGDPDERWVIDANTREAALVLPDFHDCPPAEHGEIRFDAVDLYDSWNESARYPFDSLCAPVSSGANTLVLSGGVFASWGVGSASGIGGTDTSPEYYYIRGWQADNVKVIYDYESTFSFREGE